MLKDILVLGIALVFSFVVTRKSIQDFQFLKSTKLANASVLKSEVSNKKYPKRNNLTIEFLNEYKNLKCRDYVFYESDPLNVPKSVEILYSENSGKLYIANQKRITWGIFYFKSFIDILLLLTVGFCAKSIYMRVYEQRN